MPQRHPSSVHAVTGVLTIVLTLAAWTVTPLLIHEFIDDVDPWTSNGWRYAFAALLWLPLLLAKSARGTLPPGLYRAALVPGLINAAAQVAFTAAFYHINPSMVAFGLRMQIVAVTIGAALLFPAERRVIRTPLFIVGIVLVLGGTLATVGQSEEIGQEAGALGVALAMLAGIGYAGYALAVRRFMASYGPMESFSVISQYTAVAMLALMLLAGDRGGLSALDMAPPRFGLFLLSAVIGIAAGHVLYYISISRLGVAVSTGVVQLQPFTVGALSGALTGAALSLTQWFTGGLAVAGAIIMVAVQHRVQRRARAEQLRARDAAAHGISAASAAVPPDAGLLEPALSADVPALEQ